MIKIVCDQCGEETPMISLGDMDEHGRVQRAFGPPEGWHNHRETDRYWDFCGRPCLIAFLQSEEDKTNQKTLPGSSEKHERARVSD